MLTTQQIFRILIKCARFLIKGMMWLFVREIRKTPPALGRRYHSNGISASLVTLETCTSSFLRCAAFGTHNVDLKHLELKLQIGIVAAYWVNDPRSKVKLSGYLYTLWETTKIGWWIRRNRYHMSDDR